MIHPPRLGNAPAPKAKTAHLHARPKPANTQAIAALARALGAGF